jgi:hypothetical protein
MHKFALHKNKGLKKKSSKKYYKIFFGFENEKKNTDSS